MSINTDDRNAAQVAAVGSSLDGKPILMYKVEFEDEYTKRRQDFQSKVSFGPLEVDTEKVDDPLPVNTVKDDKPALEVITTVWGRAPSNSRDLASDGANSPTFNPIFKQSHERVAFKNISIRKVGKAKLVIRSQALLVYIRRCVTYFPAQTLTADEVEIVEPYPVLVHHLDRLEESQKTLDPSYRDAEDGGATRRRLITRGRKHFELLRVMPKQMWYDGYPFEKRKQTYRGNCILDTRTAITKESYSSKFEYRFLEDVISPQSAYTDMAEQSLSDFIFSKFHDIKIEEVSSLPSDRHYFLCQPMVAGFALYDKSWKIFNVEWVSEIPPSLSMENLFIDPINHEVIQAMTYAQSHPFRLDAVRNKGEGQVVLLHGSPGVGKTYTVECIAQSTGRPLIALTMGDLLRDESQIEQQLQNWFTLAERWNAILLLDEADIFLEKRATRDIQRNGIVSIFLRRMEYFRGLFFLTTNRVGQIDDAFLSRVSVVLQYDHLSDDTRKKIWKGFFKSVQQDAELSGGKKIEISKYAQQYVLNDPEVKDLMWNGREIRNGLQTAILLASYRALQEGDSSEDSIEVEEEHFKSGVTMSKKFKTYMRGISGLGEDERAKARLERTNPQRSL